MNNTQDKPRLIRRSEVLQRVSLCKATIYNHMNAGTFPRPVSVGGRRVAWLESDIDLWIAERLAEAGRVAA
ncbi:helix-turn-helix transcriptional regulator [Rheinheimera marina]|uniref:Helix-turn-helix transcriptional regulator n=1 Tax=Rheinheimera marina TaxID=1774958 RepID=A0ABV9JN94_9GAMM